MKRFLFILFAVTALLLCSACSGGPAGDPAGPVLPSAPPSGSETGADAVGSVSSTTMVLASWEGTIALSDEAAADIPVHEMMRLFSGNRLSTEVSSRARVDLDDTKAATVGPESLTAVYQNGRELVMELLGGELYFSVSRPLDTDESFEISTSAMTLAIRGTSGYVRTEDAETSLIILTSGQAVISSSAGDEQTISAGQCVTVSVTDAGTEFKVHDITPDLYPDLLIEELAADTDVLAEAEAQSGNLADELVFRNAYALYRQAIGNAAAYDYHDTTGNTVTGYRYALVRMDPGSPVPALLLRQESSGDAGYVEFYHFIQYDAASGSLFEPDVSDLMSGTGSFGFRGGFSADGSGYGLLFSSFSAGTGMGGVTRYYIASDRMTHEAVWEGRMDLVPDWIAFEQIVWYRITDLSGLERSVPSDWTLPEDGGRLVLSGTVHHCTYAEVFRLLGTTDPSNGMADTGDTYVLFLLDTPRTLTVTTPVYTRTETVDVISFSDVSAMAAYDGQHVICSFGQGTILFPTDARVPSGVPYSADVRVLKTVD